MHVLKLFRIGMFNPKLTKSLDILLVVECALPGALKLDLYDEFARGLSQPQTMGHNRNGSSPKGSATHVSLCL